MYQVGMDSIYAASISTFVQSSVSFLEVPGCGGDHIAA